jgi:hypothetical protein
MVFVVNIPSAQGQGASDNLKLTFHNYSTMLKAENGSFYVYEGVDGSNNAVNPSQTNLNSQISGSQEVFGMNIQYWSSGIMWVVNLPLDVHVQGTVNLRVYISSTYKLSGFFSGGGYGMGLVDIDQNNNEVRQFITQAPYTQGSNPFTSTPTQYSLSVNVDYVFKAGHSIGFAVGLGATSQGFAATVYFDSVNYNCGVTLPIVNSSQISSYLADNNGVKSNVAIASNSAISNFQFNPSSGSIQFFAQGINYTTGSCTVSIPKTLLQQPFTVTSDTQKITSAINENSTYYQLYFTHTRGTKPIIVTGTLSTQHPTEQPGTTVNNSPTNSPTTESSSTQNPATSSSQATTSNGNNSQTTPNPTATPMVPEYVPILIIAVMATVTIFSTISFKRFSKGNAKI